MSTELVRVGFMPQADEWERMKELAKIIANTEFVPKGLRGRPDAVLAALVAGREMGIGSMQALQHINVLDGKINYSAELLLAKIREAGHSVKIGEHTDQVVTVTGRRADSGDTHTVTWTLEMAQAAGLTGKRNWQQYARTMLTWRAVTELARFLFPDVSHGLMSYTTEELGSEEPLPEPAIEVDAETGEIVEAEVVEEAPVQAAEEQPETTEEPVKPKRKRRTKAEMEAARAEAEQAAIAELDEDEPPPMEINGDEQAEAERIAEEVFAQEQPGLSFDEPQPVKVPDHLVPLVDMLNRLARFPEWNELNVIRQARETFGRDIQSLDDLNEEEIGRILKAGELTLEDESRG